MACRTMSSQTPSVQSLPQAQVQQLVALIVLYPDPLLTQILVASQSLGQALHSELVVNARRLPKHARVTYSIERAGRFGLLSDRTA
jgi:Protein of unknown function (DUF3300)